MIQRIEQLDLQKVYSYADYLLWQFEQHVELLRGKIYLISPSPKRIHQDILINLILKMSSLIKCRNCKIYDAPFDVRLIGKKNTKEYKDEEVYTVVQPDICVCGKTKLDERDCIGAPDLIVEILSSGTLKKDLNIKYHLYEENGVKEYWVADSQNRLMHQYYLNEEREKYEIVGYFTEEDKI